MYRKYFFIFCFILLTTISNGESNKINSEKELIESIYNKSNKYFFSSGEIIINDVIAKFSIYKEKNRDDGFNVALKIGNDIIKSISKNGSFSWNKNGSKISNNYPLLGTTIPIEIINYGTLNPNYVIQQKTSINKFKNIDSYTIELNYNMLKTDVSSVKYKKIIYTLSENNNIILKADLYINISDRSPHFNYEIDSINYINGSYIGNVWRIIDKKNNQEILFRYNIETIIYNKDEIPAEFNSLVSFNGVR